MKKNHRYELLIVDDDPQIHKLLAKMLPQERYIVQSAYNAKEAYIAVERKKPDMIILDIMMPNISGIEVLNELKSNPATQDILTIILSARDSQTDRIDGLQHGADEYISKPFHMKHLVRKIEHMLMMRRS